MRKSKAILCVDDDALILESLKTQLVQVYGHEYIIEIAESGEEALEIIDFLTERNISVLAVISDWLMPNMKGDELLVQIHQKLPLITTILLTGQADEKAVDNAFKNANLKAYIPKPWSLEAIKQVLDKVFEANKL